MIDQPKRPFDLSPEQRDTESLLRRMLGGQIADRYVDFCRLAAGEFSLRVSSPLAGHALRELEAVVRQTLAGPMDVTRPTTPEEVVKREKARSQLRALDYTAAEIDAAIDKALTPRLTHVEQIEAIVKRLDLATDGDIARAWKKLRNAHGKAHGRAFYNALAVDETFRAEWQAPLDTVMRGLMIALEGRYAAFMKRVEELAAAMDCARAAKDFANEIPGALPLLWHFFSRLTSPDWLPHLARLNLLAAPPYDEEQGRSEILPLREWPAGRYLQRMAEIDDPKTRRLVAEALRAVSASRHPHVLQSGIDIMAVLPADDAAPLVDLAEAWLNVGGPFVVIGDGIHRLIRTFAAAHYTDEALRVARVLFQVFEQEERLATLFTTHMYEHFLPDAVKALASVAGPATVALLCDLLETAVRASQRVSDDPPHDYTYYLVSEISDRDIKHDVPDALIGQIVAAARLALAADASCMEALMTSIRGHTPKIYTRIALMVLSFNPSAAPGIARTLLTDLDIIEASWCRREYAELARAWFPSLDRHAQKQILDAIDSAPNRLRPGWHERFLSHEKRLPTAEEDQHFTDSVIQELTWAWRSALPKDRREVQEKLADPEAWRNTLFQEPAPPPTTPDLATAPIKEVVAFLSSWCPDTANKRETATALAQDLRSAVHNNPERYSAQVMAFADLPAIYLRNVLQGLENAAINKNVLHWDEALKLIQTVFERPDETAKSPLEGDDRDWSWTRKAAADLLAQGLREGAQGFAFRHAKSLEALVLAVNNGAPRDPGNEDFEERYREFPYHGARATMRGAALELVLLLLFWLSKNENSAIGQSPRDALALLPDVRDLLQAELADTSANGRIPHAIIGRYLSWLFYFGETWLREHLQRLFPKEDRDLRDASWLSHLSADQGPVIPLAADMRDCFFDEIERLGQESATRNPQHIDDRFAEYMIILYIAGTLPDDVFELFWAARGAERARRHAMWFLGIEIARPQHDLPPDRYTRALTYWDRRLAAASAASDPEAFRAEIGALGQFFMRPGIDADWLMDQTLKLTEAGFAPTDGYSVVERLSKLSAEHAARAAEVLSALIKSKHFDRWVLHSHKAAMRKIMENGITSQSATALASIVQAINHLAAHGDTDFLDLLPPAPRQAS